MYRNAAPNKYSELRRSGIVLMHEVLMLLLRSLRKDVHVSYYKDLAPTEPQRLANELLRP
jgi:hypothetical protein